jgi:hypothetical protein
MEISQARSFGREKDLFSSARSRQVHKFTSEYSSSRPQGPTGISRTLCNSAVKSALTYKQLITRVEARATHGCLISRVKNDLSERLYLITMEDTYIA